MQIISLSFFIGYNSYGKDFSLKEFLEQVRDSNPSIKSAARRAEALSHRVKPASTIDDPFIAVGVDQIPFDGSMGSATRYQVSQSIPFPGKLSARGDIAESKAKSARSDSETTEREVIVLATQAFFRTFYNQNAIELNEKQKILIEGTVESTKSRYKTGDTGHHDWLLAKVEISVLKVERLRLEREQKKLFAVLNELRDKPTDAVFGNLVVKFSESKNDDVSPTKDQPEMKSLEYAVTQSEKEKKLAKLSYLPDFTIQGMAMKPSSDMMNEKDNWGVMVGINVPLYFWRKQSENVSASTLDSEAIVLEKKNLENRLNTEMVDAKQALQTTKDIVDLYRSSVIPTTNLALQNAKTGYAARKLPLTQFLETLKVQKTQELEFLAAQLDVELARTRITNLLSAPPVLRLAPSKPSLFGAGAMGGSMTSDTVNMGGGMSGPTRKTKAAEPTQMPSGAGMGNM
ncbi:MAG: hypothetical protein A4S09_15195 [Proteobacteria bacterium SG_bin7]|nr:MAG: hypothetical protein A4S09_15195 [Proteobacteria bacterium SG_bin7]